MTKLLGFNVYGGTIQDIDLKSARIINTINPHSYCITKKDTQFREVLQSSDILLPDGIGIVWASKILNKKVIHKIAGFDLFLFVMSTLNDQNGSCFFLGASQKTLDLIKIRCAREFPSVSVNSYSPPYKPVFSDNDSLKMIREVNMHNPDVVFIGMTAPKQEKWGFKHKDMLVAQNICSIGAVFDFYAGTVQRPSRFWIKLGLEWLPRFVKEPKRLAERNLISTPTFIYEVIKEKFLK